MNSRLLRSFSAAMEFPFKPLNNKKLLNMIINRKLTPIHAIIIPTNKCNMNCNFCSCKDRDRNDELPFNTIVEILGTLQILGTQALTLSGGGEPTIYPSFLNVIEEIKKKNMRTGLVTNGRRNDILMGLDKGDIEWCRISFGDGRDFDEVKAILDSTSALLSKQVVKYAGISYVITDTFDYGLAEYICDYVDKSDIGYLKFTVDLRKGAKHNLPNIKGFKSGKTIIAPFRYKVSEEHSCKMELIKPVFAADGFVYPCCEMQYNNQDGKDCYSSSNRVCRYDEFLEVVERQIPYSKAPCARCYHSALVEYLNSIDELFVHEDWI